VGRTGDGRCFGEAEYELVEGEEEGSDEGWFEVFRVAIVEEEGAEFVESVLRCGCCCRRWIPSVSGCMLSCRQQACLLVRTSKNAGDILSFLLLLVFSFQIVRQLRLIPIVCWMSILPVKHLSVRVQIVRRNRDVSLQIGWLCSCEVGNQWHCLRQVAVVIHFGIR